MEKNTDNNPKRKGLFTSLIWLFLTIMMVIALVYSLKMDTNVTKDEYYKIVNYFDQNKVTEYSLNLSSRKLTYVLKGEKEKRSYTVPNAQLFIEDVHENVREYNKANPKTAIKMDYEAGTSSSWLVQIVPMVLLTVGVGLVFWWLLKKMNNTMMNENNRTMSFGKARLKSGADEQRKTTFDDVAGVDEEKEDLQEIVEFLRNPGRFNELGARIPKGVLLVGPPGTGKTLLARAVAGEADATFLSISGSDFVEMYVGVGASRVRDLFETAKKNVPAIIFIDEIDAVGRHRGAGMGGGHDEREQTLNQLLVEMDGFGANVGVIIIAATNRPDILDPALLRPGRFDRQVTVNYPDVLGREAILKVHAKNKPIGPDVRLDEIARATSGFTGADLENLLNEAALLAARRGKKALTKAEIEEATIKVVVGTEKKSKKVTDKEKKLTAYHEAGHAITNYYLESLDPVHQISIIPRGRAGGYTMSLPKEDKSYVSKRHMLDELVTLLGGRVSESLILGDISTGASNDIERATNIARGMITKYGMNDKLGPITYGNDNDEVFIGKDYNHVRNYSEDTAAIIDKEIAKTINKAYEKAEELLNAHKDKLHLLAAFLIEFEKIDGPVFERLMSEKDFTVLKYKDEIKKQDSSKKPEVKSLVDPVVSDTVNIKEDTKDDAEPLNPIIHKPLSDPEPEEKETVNKYDDIAGIEDIKDIIDIKYSKDTTTISSADNYSAYKDLEKDLARPASLTKDEKKADKKKDSKVDDKDDPKDGLPEAIPVKDAKEVVLTEAELALKKEIEAELAATPVAEHKPVETHPHLTSNVPSLGDLAPERKEIEKKADKSKKINSHAKSSEKISNKPSNKKAPANKSAQATKKDKVATVTDAKKAEPQKKTGKDKKDVKTGKDKKSSDKSDAKKPKYDDVFLGSGITDEDIKPKALPLVTDVATEASLVTDTPAETSVLMPNDPFVSTEEKKDEEKHDDVLPGMDTTSEESKETEKFNNEPLDIGSFINSMTNFNADMSSDEDEKKKVTKREELKSEDVDTAEADAYDSDFNYEEERSKGNFTENDEIYALYELLKQTRDYSEDNDDDPDWKKKMNDDQ